MACVSHSTCLWVTIHSSFLCVALRSYITSCFTATVVRHSHLHREIYKNKVVKMCLFVCFFPWAALSISFSCASIPWRSRETDGYTHIVCHWNRGKSFSSDNLWHSELMSLSLDKSRYFWDLLTDGIILCQDFSFWFVLLKYVF